MLGRTPASIARKLGNLGAFDPQLAAQDISGLKHGSKLDRRVWDEFHNDWNGLVLLAHRLRDRYVASAGAALPVIPEGPSERIVTAKQRLHQAFFRDAVISSYSNRCCITGLPIVECLVAGHIVPWHVDERRRADPTNGLCLSATFDRLYETGLITVERDMTVTVSKHIGGLRDLSVRKLVAQIHGRRISAPTRFPPNHDCLLWHRKNRFRSA